MDCLFQPKPPACLRQIIPVQAKDAMKGNKTQTPMSPWLKSEKTGRSRSPLP